MDGRSQRLLEWYFSQTAFERSSSGSMLERASSIRAGVLATNRERQERLAGAYARRKSSDPWDPDPVNRRPTVHHQPAGRQEPSHDDLTRYAVASRCLDSVGAEPFGSRHRLVLGTYCGAPGVHFAEPAGVGMRPGQLPAALPRVFCLLHLTPEGKKLLEKGPRSEFDLPTYARMRVACLMREAKAYRDVQPLFVGAEQRAELWLEEAGDAWRSSGAAAAVAAMRLERRAPDT